MLAVCYLPPAGSGGCPADLDAWWEELAVDWAAAEGQGLVLLGGDLNARTGRLQDWPDEELGWQPRRSSDTNAPNGHGRRLACLLCLQSV